MMAERPNVLWICTDQQRFDTIAALGNSRISTPNIDKLASEGVTFTRAYSQSPVCTPSRAAFLTGRYPRTARCRQNGAQIPPDEILVTRLLAEDGYDCGLVGKLHLGRFNHFAIYQQVHIVVQLFFYGFYHFRMPVANIAYADACNEVEVFFTGGVAQGGTARFHDLETQRCRRGLSHMLQK